MLTIVFRSTEMTQGVCVFPEDRRRHSDFKNNLIQPNQAGV